MGGRVHKIVEFNDEKKKPISTRLDAFDSGELEDRIKRGPARKSFMNLGFYHGHYQWTALRKTSTKSQSKDVEEVA